MTRAALLVLLLCAVALALPQGVFIATVPNLPGGDPAGYAFFSTSDGPPKTLTWGSRVFTMNEGGLYVDEFGSTWYFDGAGGCSYGAALPPPMSGPPTPYPGAYCNDH